jgi:MoxR-like ATPase
VTNDSTAIAQIQRRYGIVGRQAELAAALAALSAGRDLLLEGPTGVGKSTVALAVCKQLGRELVRFDAGGDRGGGARGAVMPRDGGAHDGEAAPRDDGAAAFVAGPLAEAMRDGRLLFIARLDYLPESSQDALAAALKERLVRVPLAGEVRAASGFAVVATCDPGDPQGAGRLADALGERFERLTLGYQSAADEAAIVAADSGSDDVSLVGVAVRVTRGTRLHPGFARGASVRGASDMVTITEDLWAENRDACGAVNRETLRRAAEAALAPLVTLCADTDLATALDDLLELVCGRGQDPDVVLAAGAARADGRGVALER